MGDCVSHAGCFLHVGRRTRMATTRNGKGGTPAAKRKQPEAVEWHSGAPNKLPVEAFKTDEEEVESLEEFKKRWEDNINVTIDAVNPFRANSQLTVDQQRQYGNKLFQGARDEAMFLGTQLVGAQKQIDRAEIRRVAAAVIADSAVMLLETLVGPMARSAVFQLARGYMAPQGEPLNEEEALELEQIFTKYGGQPLPVAEAAAELAAEEQEFNARNPEGQVLKGAVRSYIEDVPKCGATQQTPTEVMLQQLRQHATEVPEGRAAFLNHEFRRLGAQMNGCGPNGEVLYDKVGTLSLAQGLVLMQINAPAVHGKEFNGGPAGWPGDVFNGDTPAAKRPSVEAAKALAHKKEKEAREHGRL